MNWITSGPSWSSSTTWAWASGRATGATSRSSTSTKVWRWPRTLPISRNTSFPDPILKLQVKTASPLHFGLRKTLASQLLQFAAVAMPEAQVDELRWQISDRRVFRFAAQQLVSLVHVAFDYLAFSEDVGFYVGRETFHGISKASLVWNLVRDLILYLYLQEQEAGLVVLFGLMLALLSDFFKIQRVLKPALVIRPRFPLFFIVTAPLRTPPAKATAKYDKEATSHLYLATFPMLFGVALYSLVHDVHRTYYGWIVSSLADLVYYFGFIMMTPQLYINYKLQSVAHLPIRVFAYKIFNTFRRRRLRLGREDAAEAPPDDAARRRRLRRVPVPSGGRTASIRALPNRRGFAADYGGVQATTSHRPGRRRRSDCSVRVSSIAFVCCRRGRGVASAARTSLACFFPALGAITLAIR